MMKTPPISPFLARVKPSSRLALGLTLGCAPFLAAQIAAAQGGPIALPVPVPAPPATAATSPVPVPAPAPSAPDINVLIIALDDVAASDKTPPYVAPITNAPANPVAPIAPADGAPPAITPAGFNGQLWQWRGVAQKKTKEQKKRDKEAEDAKIFNVNPVAQTPYTPPGRNNPLALPPAAANANGAVTGVPNAPIVRAPDGTLAPVPNNVEPPVVVTAGRAQLVALPLRRVLYAQGYRDVRIVTLESPTITYAIGEGRLSQRVLDELRSSLATLAANSAAGVPADVNATIAAGRAASRIGQATGYRAVVGLAVSAPTAIGVVGAAATPDASTQKIAANMIVADAQRESVEPLKFVETGDTPAVWQETGGAAGARLLDGTLRDWPATSSDNRAALSQVHFNSAQAAFDRGDIARAQDEVNQSIALDGSRPQTYLLRGDILKAIDPTAAATSYRRAVELNSKNGEDWARIAAAYAYAKTPDWPAALSAGQRALGLNYDSAQLRVAMATAQYGRAAIFRSKDYPSQANTAEDDARVHLDRALQLAPDDPTAVRLLARNLLEKRRFEEAALTLDRIAPRYPKDLEIQGQYAVALGNQVGREEDAFAAYSRVWKLSGQSKVTVDAITYRTLASGFDQRLFNLGKIAVQLSRGAATRAILRDTALIQLSKLKEEMEDAKDSIGIMQPSTGVSATAVAARVFAADLMDQSLESFQTYLDTGQGTYFERGDGLYRQAVAQLNTARSTQ